MNQGGAKLSEEAVGGAEGYTDLKETSRAPRTKKMILATKKAVLLPEKPE